MIALNCHFTGLIENGQLNHQILGGDDSEGRDGRVKFNVGGGERE